MAHKKYIAPTLPETALQRFTDHLQEPVLYRPPEVLNPYHTSRLKRELEARYVNMLHGMASLAIVQAVQATSIRIYGYAPFTDQRMGQYGINLRVPKVQTYEHSEWRTVDESKLDFIIRMIRDMGLDELPQLAWVSSDPDVPGEMALFGFRPQRPRRLNDTRKVLYEHGYHELHDRWRSKRDAVPAAVYDVTSLLDTFYTPGTIDYELTAVQMQEYYHDFAGPRTDTDLFMVTVIGGARRLEKMGLVTIDESSGMMET